MKDFLKWLVIGPVVGLGLYFLSGKDININTDVLEKSVNAEDIFNKTSEDTGQSEIDALIETFKEVCAEGSQEEKVVNLDVAEEVFLDKFSHLLRRTFNFNKGVLINVAFYYYVACTECRRRRKDIQKARNYSDALSGY